MGSYINIGVVSNKNKQDFIRNCENLFQQNNIYFGRIKFEFPEDEECKVWNESERECIDLGVLEKCYQNELAEITVNCEVEGRLVQNIIIKIKRKEGSYTGILFEIPEENFDLACEIDILEKKIIDALEQSISDEFEYAFCDNEVDIEYSFREILEKNIEYSILALNKSDRLTIKLGSWRIDGLTSRKRKSWEN